MAANPLRQDVYLPGLGIESGQLGYSTEAHERYRAEHESFRVKLPEFFTNLHKKFLIVSMTTEVRYRIVNDGAATAEGLTVDLELQGDWRMTVDKIGGVRLYDSIVRPPTAPSPPRVEIAPGRSAGEIFPLSPTTPPRDPADFYWTTRPDGEERCARLRCEEFRAQRSRDGTLWVHPLRRDVVEGNLCLDVHHRTGSAPIKVDLALRVVDREVDWQDARVLDRAGGWLKIVLSGGTFPA